MMEVYTARVLNSGGAAPDNGGDASKHINFKTSKKIHQ